MKVCVIGTFDSKRQAFKEIIEYLNTLGHETFPVNAGSRPYEPISGSNVAEVLTEEKKLDFFLGTVKSQVCSPGQDQTQEVIETIKKEGTEKIQHQYLTHKFDAIISCGGSNGTDVAMALFDSLPDSVKKICISTLAPKISHGDIHFIPSVTDIVDMNPILKAVIRYACRFTAGEQENLHSLDYSNPVRGIMEFLESIVNFQELRENSEKIVAISMFGNTTPCVEACVKYLRLKRYYVMVFHVVGIGGEVMAELIRKGVISGGLLDVTTSELADFYCGGSLAADESRFFAAGDMGLPLILVPGCIDIINYNRGELPQARDQYPKLDWGPFTLSRTTPSECEKIGAFLANVANTAKGPVAVHVPETFSKLGQKGDIFYFPEADKAFLTSLKSHLQENIQLVEYPLLQSINWCKELSTFKWGLYLRGAYFGVNTVNQTLRQAILARLKAKIAAGQQIVGCGAGTGLNAAAQEAGGADLILVYNSGFFRTHGVGSLAGMMPYGNANEIAFDLGKFILNSVESTPVLVGLCASDPTFNLEKLMKKVVDLGFLGVQNFPTVGLIDESSHFRQCLEETGMGYKREIQMIRKAREFELLTTPYVFTEGQAQDMARAGADVIVIHLGLTAGWVHGSQTQNTQYDLDQSVDKIKSMISAVAAVRDDLIILAHGGPLNSVETYQYILSKVGNEQLHGFYGASAIERTPAYEAIKETVKKFSEV